MVPLLLVASLLAVGRRAYQKLLVVSKQDRQSNFLSYSDSRIIPDRIDSLYRAYVRLIVRGEAQCNIELGAEI